MAKKVKLSSREQAAKAKGGTLNYKTGKISVAPKVSSRAVASKAPVATGPAIGPLMPGQIRSNSGPAIGPLLPNQTRATTVPSKSSSSSRDLAAKAQQKKLNPASSVKAAEASGLLGTQSMVPAGDTIKGGGGGLLDKLKSKGMGIMSSIGQASFDRGAGIAGASGRRTQEELMNNRRTLSDNAFGIPTVNASVNPDLPSGVNRDDFESLFPQERDDMNPTSTGPNGEQYFNDFGPDDMSLQSKFLTAQKTNPVDQTRGNNPFGVPTANAAELNYTPDNYRQNKSEEKNYSSQYDLPEAPTQEEITQQQNELYGNIEQAPIDQAPPQVTRQVRGSGMFGTGKGVGNPAGGQDDPYIKELRKAYSSNGGEKWLRKQFEELIAALDPTYAQMQKEGTDALNAQLNNDNIKLASVMNANNTGDSEQRAQLMAQQQQGTQTALGNLLAKLAQNKAQDVSGYKSQMADKMGQYRSQQQSNQQRLMEQIQQYRQRQEDQAYKNASLAGRGNTPQKAGTLSYLGDDANGNPVYYNTTTGERTTEAGLKRKQSNPLEEAMAALLGQGGGGGQQVQYDENGRPYIEQ